MMMIQHLPININLDEPRSPLQINLYHKGSLPASVYRKIGERNCIFCVLILNIHAPLIFNFYVKSDLLQSFLLVSGTELKRGHRRTPQVSESKLLNMRIVIGSTP